MPDRRPLARLRKLHKGKRRFGQRASHQDNLRRELRATTKRDAQDKEAT